MVFHHHLRGARPIPCMNVSWIGLCSFFQDRHAIVDGDPEDAFADDGVVTVEGEVTVRMRCVGRRRSYGEDALSRQKERVRYGCRVTVESEMAVRECWNDGRERGDRTKPSWRQKARLGNGGGGLPWLDGFGWRGLSVRGAGTMRCRKGKKQQERQHAQARVRYALKYKPTEP